ncbi:hypothetical protein F5Y16DRAFT_365972 [Xylariaceae sp. FL0255]|nr:hypothetical protein F5Y16DRAFT_365972 [Xylariaceae sp. FL0255]
MEFFENQVGEVRYLTNLAADPSTAAANNNSNNNNAQPPATSPASANVVTDGLSNTPITHNQSRPSTAKTGDKKTRKQSAAATAAARRNTAGALPASNTTPTAPAAIVTTPVTGTKRKPPVDDDDFDDEEPQSATRPAPQQRSKRNRYISIACNECKRRKIKCNGETPCQRCGHLNLQCLYAPNCCSGSVKDSDEFKQMAAQVSRLQEQVDSLVSNMNSLRNDTSSQVGGGSGLGQQHAPQSTSSTPTSSFTLPRPDLLQHRQPPVFRGPTSNNFSLDVAKNTLHKMGYSYPGDNNDAESSAPDVSSIASPKTLPNITGLTQTQQQQDIIWELGLDEMIRLCRVYQEEVGVLYPVLDVEVIIRHARTLCGWIEAAKRNGFARSFGAQEGGIKDSNTLLLKIVLCSSMLVEGHGSSPQAQVIFDSVKPIADRMLMSEPANAKNLQFLALIAAYYFLSAEEVLCWRVMGQVTRLCMELGLHRRDVIDSIQDEEERRMALHTFWSTYVLDRRWSFSAGLPYAVSDDEIDPSLPYPEHYPFMEVMVVYSRLSADVWRFVRQFDYNDTPTDTTAAELELLDQRIKQWYSALPIEVRLQIADWEDLPPYIIPSVNSKKEYNLQRTQIWTWLRLNQIRVWLITPILHTHSSIMDNLAWAETAVKLAKNTIRYLTHLNNTTDLYRKMEIFYHQFLSSAITVLFVASCHAPVNFSSSCRDEFYMALDLVKDMSAKSWISKRLWGTVKSLRDVAPRLGLAEDPHSSAALTMAGLATAQPPQQAQSQPAQPGSGNGSSPAAAAVPFINPNMIPVSSPAFEGARIGLQMTNEMSRIFEGISGKNGAGAGAVPQQQQQQAQPGPPPPPHVPGPYGARSVGVYPFRDPF